MSYLIDTHILLWLLFSPDRLSTKVKLLIEDPDNKILVSQISLWEISLKYGLGKLKLIGYTPDDFIAAIEKMNLSILELNAAHVLSFYKLRQTEHRDPFDRLIIWQAISLSIPLLSKDAMFQQYQLDGLDLMWN